MPVDGATRHKLHTSARATLGPEEGDALMELLPPIGWDDFATKHDLHELETRLGYRFEAIDHKFDAESHRSEAFEARIDHKLEAFEARVDRRFEKVDDRFETVGDLFEKVDDRFKTINDRFDTIESLITDRFEYFESKVMAAVHKTLLWNLFLTLGFLSTVLGGIAGALFATG